MKIGNHELTEEMKAAVSHVLNGNNAKCVAFAGGGKSTLLRAIEKYHTNKKGLYICYNKTLELDARKEFEGHDVHIATSHSLALNSFDDETKNLFLKKIQRKINYSHLGKFTSLDTESDLAQRINIKSNWLMIIAITKSFSFSASKSLSHIHIPQKVKDFVNKLIKDNCIHKHQKDDCYDFLVTHAIELSSAILNPHSDCPCEHDDYMKHWQLTEPVLNYDYIMFDEAQDANPVILEILLNQSCQMIFVGDQYQNIYQFRGGINAMSIAPFDEFHMSTSFRYGKEIAQLATKVLKKSNKKIEITGFRNEGQVIKASEFESFDKTIFYISRSNKELQDMLIECYKLGTPTVVLGSKVKDTLLKLDSLLYFLTNNDKYKVLYKHQRFSSYGELVKYERDPDIKSLILMLDDDQRKGELLREALLWSLEFNKDNAKVILSTAHGSKGLESDIVFLSDDFQHVIKSFKHGRPLDEAELNLIYVAITRAKKTLILADELYDALHSDLAFTINKFKPEPYLFDGLPDNNQTSIPIKKTVATKEKVQNKQPEKKSPVIPGQKQVTVQNKHSNSDPIKIIMGNSVADHTDVVWQPTNTNEYLNPNMGVLGTMGTGKTQAIRSIIYQLHKQRAKNVSNESLGMLIFDYKGDYIDDEFLKFTDATLIQPIDIPINPFALSKLERQSIIQTTRAFTSTLAKTFKLGVKQQQTLNNCILTAYENKGITKDNLESLKKPAPTMKDVIAVYNGLKTLPNDSLTAALLAIHQCEVFEKDSRKCKSLYEMLDGNTVVVSIGECEPQLQTMIVAILIDIFYMQMKQSEKPIPLGHLRALKKLILVDEAEKFMSNDYPSLLNILKEGREYGNGCILSTQEYSHFKTAENEYSNYVDAWLVHKVPDLKSNQVGALFNLTKPEDKNNRKEEVAMLEKHYSFFINSKKESIYQQSTAFWKLNKTSN